MLLLFPAALVVRAGPRALGAYSFDQAGHLWAMWHASVEPLTHTQLLSWPAGLDLLPALGGWADIVLGSWLLTLLPLEVSYNVVIGLYFWLAGVGGYTLSRVLGVRPIWAVVAGVMFQLEPNLLRHAGHGQVEQVGVGMVALAMAGALACRDHHRRSVAVMTGLAGAAVVVICLEYALLLACAMAVLSPALLLGENRGQLRRQWGIAAGVTAVVAGPWALVFLQHTTGVRSLSDDGFNLINAAAHAIPIVDWFRMRPHMGPLFFVPLLLIPWTTPQRNRRLWQTAGVGLLLAAAFACGPDPRLWGPPADPALPPVAQWWSPFALMQRLPVLGWYHWPDRIMIFWPLAAACAMALLLQRTAKNSRFAAGVLAALVLGLATREGVRAAPKGVYQLPNDPALLALAQEPQSGAILDLPVEPIAQRVLRYQLFQIRHQHPLPFHSFPHHLHYSTSPVFQSHVAQWSMGQTPAPPDRAAIQELRNLGISHITLHRPWLRGPQYQHSREAIEAVLGSPLIESPVWACWSLAAP